jgi:uncharacterized membrane protein YfcA
VRDLLLPALLTALVGGLMRGTTGFGASMIMTPLLALMFGPKIAVPVALLLETFAAAPMLPSAARVARWDVIAPICVAAVLAVPLGSLILTVVEPSTLRRLIALTVIVFSLALLWGRRFQGQHRWPMSVGLGVLSGTMLGATSIGGPPVILYLLSGPDPLAVTRANLTLYIVVVSAAGLAMLGLAGLLDMTTLKIAAGLTIPFVIGVVAGSRLFSRFSSHRLRQVAIAFMFFVSVGVLLA